jgi:hypothetical protein
MLILCVLKISCGICVLVCVLASVFVLCGFEVALLSSQGISDQSLGKLLVA